MCKVCTNSVYKDKLCFAHYEAQNFTPDTMARKIAREQEYQDLINAHPESWADEREAC